MKKSVKLIIFIIITISILFIYGRFINTKGLKTYEYGVVDKNLPESFNGLKIVHFGSILFGRTTTISDINNVVKEINNINPDIVIYDGDLYESNIGIIDKDKNKIIESLKKINSKMGKYAISGDNDKKDYGDILKKADFTILDNAEIKLYNGDNNPIILTNDFSKSNENYTIGIIHKPDDIDKINHESVNIILAGHSLHGQIRIPFYGALLKRDGAKKYVDDKFNVNNTLLYISGGIGTNDIGIRIKNPPSINFYRLSNR